MALFQVPTTAECLYSTVRNVATTTRFFGFLPPHGRRLACGEEVTVFGNIQAWLQRFTPNDRAKRSLQEALTPTDGSSRSLVIVNTPAVHLFDATLDITRILVLDNGSFATADPCWGQYSSSSIACA